MKDKNFFYKFYYEWWKNIDKFIFSIICLLFITGLFFSLVSTSLIASDRLNTNDYGESTYLIYTTLSNEDIYK